MASLATALAVALAAAGLILAAAPAMAGSSRAGGPAHAGSATTASARHAKAPAKKKRKPAKRPAKPPLPLKMIWGPLTLPDGASAFPTYHHLGVQVLQLQLIWGRTALTRPSEPTNPADPAYRWPPELEQAIQQAARYHIALAVMVKGTPAWANGGLEESWAPTNAVDYANFMQAASRRYPSVRYWMIWGEPTTAGNFNPMPANSPVGPRRYALLLEAAYGALKAVSRSNIVIGGMTWTAGLVYPANFIKWMRLPNGKPPRLDYYGHNPYSFRFPDLAQGPELDYAAFKLEPHAKKKRKPPILASRDISDIDTLHSELAAIYKHRAGGPPKLWLSEFSISSNSPSRAFEFFVSEPEQATWLTAAFKLVDLVSYVAGLGWYDLLDETPSVPRHLTEGLMTATGTPKPDFNAYVKAH